MRTRNWTSNLRSRSKTCWDDHKTIESAERKECYYPSGEEEKFWSAGIGWTSTGDGRADHALQEFGNESPIPSARRSRPEWSCEKSDEKGESTEWKRHERPEKVRKILGRTTKSSQRVLPATTYECDQSTRRQRPCQMSTDPAKHSRIHYIYIPWNALREARIKLAINHCARQWREWVLCTYPWCCTRTKSEIPDGRLGSEIRPNRAERFVSSKRYCCKTRSRQTTSRANPIPLGPRTRGEQWPGRKIREHKTESSWPMHETCA